MRRACHCYIKKQAPENALCGEEEGVERSEKRWKEHRECRKTVGHHRLYRVVRKYMKKWGEGEEGRKLASSPCIRRRRKEDAKETRAEQKS
jgi:hypothetical protein